MARKKEGAEDAGDAHHTLTDKKIGEIFSLMEKKFRKNSSELRDLMKDIRSELSEIRANLQTSLEKQTLESLTAIKSVVDFMKRSDTSSADILTQLSSLRDYLARQQNLVTRFQDGYDWTILKNFCHRIIRCIDDLGKRLDSEDDISNQHRQDLEMIYDQLVFALDGSGIEQFRPESDIPYSGQEKIAEVVGKDPLKRDAEPGHISRIVCPGYYYCLNEEQHKLIRPAKVRLYERKHEGSDEVE